MKKSRFSETQIVSILKQADAGVPIKDVCRQAGISTPTYYKWKSKYGGLEASDLKRVKELEAENTQLKRIYPTLQLPPKTSWAQTNASVHRGLEKFSRSLEKNWSAFQRQRWQNGMDDRYCAVTDGSQP